jgi:hypothetical protein
MWKCSSSINGGDHYHKKGKKIYNHEQIVVCLTLKFQATPHFLGYVPTLAWYSPFLSFWSIFVIGGACSC